jgi:hypothetical protein
LAASGLDFHLDSGVIPAAECLTTLSIVVHAGLAVLGAVDGVPLPELDLSQGVQFVVLPSNEGIEIRVGFGCQGSSDASRFENRTLE